MNVSRYKLNAYLKQFDFTKVDGKTNSTWKQKWKHNQKNIMVTRKTILGRTIIEVSVKDYNIDSFDISNSNPNRIHEIHAFQETIKIFMNAGPDMYGEDREEFVDNIYRLQDILSHLKKGEKIELNETYMSFIRMVTSKQ